MVLITGNSMSSFSTSSIDVDSTSSIPPWSRFNQWIHSICIVMFDLELGQVLEVMYPGDAILSAQEKANICYLAFPDSNNAHSRDTKYHFRIRRSQSDVTSYQQSLILNSPSNLPIHPQFLYGFVHFRQERDLSIPRGFYQKSVVLLSIIPFFHLYSTIIEKIALGYFEMGEPAIEAACHDMDQWGPPIAGQSFQLPIMGTVIQCRLPSACDIPFTQFDDIRLNVSDGIIKIKSIYEPDIYKNLQSVMKHIQLVWELVITGEPLLIMASSPTRVASIVQSLVALISPLRYASDFRPYFTIHDSEFREYTGRSKHTARVILGVTNPFFVKALDHWPHILKVSDVSEIDSNDKQSDKTRKHWDGRILDAKDGLFTQYKPFLQRDEGLLKKLSKDGPSEMHSSVLQRHLLELTQSFMIPLERYLSSLMPLRKEMSPFKSIPSVRPFVIQNFLMTLEEAGPSLTCGIKGDWTGLYRRFIVCPSFAEWLSSRSSSMSQQIKSVYVDSLCDTMIDKEVLAQRHHVEIVDLVLRIRQRVVEMESSSVKRNQLISQIRNILNCVDDDLKCVLESNCSLRDILA
uniref:UDENN domain-containing protein n=1 Tax=Pristionchus pacificus TaxID=54126 RepID=A0A8R1U7B8_PRIPA